MIDQFDCVIPFHLEKSNIRGRLVRLDELMRDIIKHHNYPALVNYYLAEATTLSVAVVSCFKFEGLFTLQITGNGPLNLLVVDINKEGHVRACAKFDQEKIKSLDEAGDKNMRHLFGEGHFAFTLEPEQEDTRYQGIVELMGANLADATHHFFRQSEQLETGIVLASSEGVTEATLASSALMIQRLPLPTHISIDLKEQLDDEWIHAMSLVGSMTKKELLDRQLSNEDLLYRLFWENGVRVHEPKTYISQCRCSSSKIQHMLMSFSALELKDMVMDDKINVTCEFCGRQYEFGENEIVKS
ncbi:Hsp33 family molecular chaperone HslO [Candidatus Paracaedibacter symbiosus]|uniref:Hsp33 family molecular chaperone HslO n=1 Tax=Candidatus Paracaedibacter symbiosus TaxID=244582 RepID=UPI00068BB333|nr:Hsp33 family molecular chaperone HslO [Candidatus Paracaedibacter symbiosus]